MGSFSVSCSLSGEVISSSDEVVIIPMTEMKNNTSLYTYSWSKFAPIPIMIEGVYNSYGGLKKAKVFDSKGLLTKEELLNVNKVLLNFFIENLNNDSDKKNTIGDFIGTRIKRITKDFKCEVASAMLNNIKALPSNDDEMKKALVDWLISFGFKDELDAQKYCDENKDKKVEVPLCFMFVKKEKMLSLLSNYGIEYLDDNLNDEDVYAQKLQKQRVDFKNTTETVKFVSGGDYAGANQPSFSWKSISDREKGSKSGLNKLYHLHGVELALINDYFSLLGKVFSPSVVINEGAKNYGLNNALEMQEKLVSVKKDSKLKIK